MAYFPNGSAGEYFEEQCCNCIIGYDKPCPIHLVQHEFNYKQFDKDGNDTDLSRLMNMLVSQKGDCQLKIAMDKTKHYKELVKLSKRLVR